MTIVLVFIVTSDSDLLGRVKWTSEEIGSEEVFTCLNSGGVVLEMVVRSR